MTMDASVRAAFRQVAVDQLAQDLDFNEKLKAISGSGDAHVVAVQQLIGFYNGYKGESLDYRDYLTLTDAEVSAAWYAFGTAYLGK